MSECMFLSSAKSAFLSSLLAIISREADDKFLYKINRKAFYHVSNKSDCICTYITCDKFNKHKVDTITRAATSDLRSLSGPSIPIQKFQD